MSVSLQEIAHVFSQKRTPVKLAHPGFDTLGSVRQLSAATTRANLQYMLQQEKPPCDYLQRVHANRLDASMREESYISILQFAVQTELLDQTVLQACSLADEYMQQNPNILPAFLKIVFTVCLEIAIKVNEHVVLALEDIVAIFKRKFTLAMLVKLERHILMTNSWRIQTVTSWDFLLYFLLALPFWADRQPQAIADQCLPFLHYCCSNYQLSCSFKKSTVAIAAICYVLQEAEPEEYQPFSPKTMAHRLRDDWLCSLHAQGIDLAQVQSLLETVRYASGRASALWPMQI
jgi:hypothetical protein